MEGGGIVSEVDERMCNEGRNGGKGDMKLGRRYLSEGSCRGGKCRYTYRKGSEWKREYSANIPWR